jgi:hypothetical protein
MHFSMQDANNATLRQWRSTRGRSFRRTTDTGTSGYPSSCWPTEYPHMGQWHDTRQHRLCVLRLTCGLSGAPPDKENLQLTMWRTSWNGCKTSIIMPINTEGGQLQDKRLLRPTIKLCWITGRTPGLVPPLDSDQSEVSEPGSTLGRSLQGGHPDQRCGL